MDPRRFPRSPALLLALLPALCGPLSCRGNLPENEEAASRSEASISTDPTSSAPSDGVSAAAQNRIAQREYRASTNRNGLQAPNRAHNLRTYFDTTGIRVHDRSQTDSPELLALDLAGVGRGERPEAVEPGVVTSDGARVEIQRPGLVEWYENSPAGLEQGVTLTRRPPGDGPLVVELRVRGALASLRGDRVNFATPTGRQLSYAKLAAQDARGSGLAAHFALPEPSRLQLLVDDRAAVYPIVIDPLLTGSADTQIVSHQVSANMGTSVAGAGDVNGDGYDDLIIGASGYDAGEANEGAAFIFLGGPDGIADADPATAATQLESNQAGAYLGVSVAGAGDVNDDGYDDVIVGAYLYDAGQADEGAAFVFLGSAAGIPDGDPSTADAQLEADQAGASMGYSVAGAGDVDDDGYADVIVGAYLYDTGLANLRCTALSGGGSNRNFPFLCCTGPGTGTCVNEGAAFVFRGSAAGIASGTPASADSQLLSNTEGSWMGWSVAGAGDINGDDYADVIAGAPAWSTTRPPMSPIPTVGSALIFHGSAAGVPDGNPTTADTQIVSEKTRSQLGNSVAGAGDVNGDGFDDVIVGAYRHDTLPPTALQDDEGVALIYMGSAAGIPDGRISTAFTILDSNQMDAQFGFSVAGAGDIDSDGYDDVIVGATRYDAGEDDEGAAFVFLGSAAGIPNGDLTTAAVQLESNQPYAWLGWGVDGAGDVNGDGADDVIVSAPLFDESGISEEGAVYVFLSDPVLVGVPEPSFGLGLAAAVAGLATLAGLRRRRARSA